MTGCGKNEKDAFCGNVPETGIKMRPRLRLRPITSAIANGQPARYIEMENEGITSGEGTTCEG